MVDLTTSYLGLKLKNPVVASASPLSQKLESAKKLEAAGVSAIVMYSLFEEQIIRESLKLHEDLSRGEHQFAEAASQLPTVGVYAVGPDAYLKKVSELKKALTIPLIGSLNGVSSGGWVDYAHKIQEAGADALELNLYTVATDPDLPAGELEERYLRLVSEVRAQVRIPLAVKLSPFFTALPNFAKRLAEAGADGLVLFNRFYQPDFDLDELEVAPNLVLSTSQELRLPLRWIAILYGRVNADFALTSGVHTSQDLIKALMAGARVAMIASEFLQHGVERAASLVRELEAWMVEREYSSVTQMTGSMSQQSVGEPGAFERANYMTVLSTY